MTLVFVALALLMISLVTALALTLDKPPRAPPPPPARWRPPRKVAKTKTNPFGVPDATGAMILSRRVLSNLPLPPPPTDGTAIDVDGPFGDDVKTLVAHRHREQIIIEIEVDD
jgi:hypothetical protein